MVHDFRNNKVSIIYHEYHDGLHASVGGCFDGCCPPKIYKLKKNDTILATTISFYDFRKPKPIISNLIIKADFANVNASLHNVSITAKHINVHKGVKLTKCKLNAEKIEKDYEYPSRIKYL